MSRAIRGMTLLELLVSAAILTVIVGGTMAAFGAAVKLSHQAPRDAEGLLLGHQTIERFRNKVACRQPSETPSDTWFSGACAADRPSGWVSDPVVVQGVGTSVRNLNVRREYQVTSGTDDFDRDGQPDYLQVRVKVQWSGPQ